MKPHCALTLPSVTLSRQRPSRVSGVRTRSLLLGLCLGCALSARADWETFTFSLDQNPLAIPDGNSNGLNDTRQIHTTLPFLQGVRLTVSIAGVDDGGFNGDLYAVLTHGQSSAVLLNRPGRTSLSPFGYADSGFFNLTFDDAAPAGDVHLYRLAATGSPQLPLAGPLTGTWQPDGRNVSPDLVLESDPRTAPLSGLAGQAADGEWTLFVADLSSGGQSTLTGWTLQLNVVPEPSTSSLFACAAAIWVWRRWDARVKTPSPTPHA